MRSSLQHQKYAKQLFKLSLDAGGKLSLSRVEALLHTLRNKPALEKKGILKAYLRLLREASSKENYLLEHASPLSQEQLSAFEGFFSAHYKKAIKLQTNLNPSLIGGVRVHIGSDIWEQSIFNHLNQWIHYANS